MFASSVESKFLTRADDAVPLIRTFQTPSCYRSHTSIAGLKKRSQLRQQAVKRCYPSGLQHTESLSKVSG